MKIKDKRPFRLKKKFKDLHIGDAFEEENGDICMKTTPVSQSDDSRSCWNAVDLQYGVSLRISDDTAVTPLDADLMINSKEKAENTEHCTFATAFEWMRDGGKVTNGRLWDDDCIAMLNEDGNLVDGCGDLFGELNTEEIFNDEWILINEQERT